MTLNDLRAFLARADVQALPGDTPVGATGHYGEFIEAYDTALSVETVSKLDRRKRFVAVIIPAINIGPDPY